MGKNLPDNVKVLRSIIQHQEEINSINPHTFGDASSQGLLAAAYAITHQPLGILQGLVAAKSSITKKGVIITRFQPVAGHMATNLVHNVKSALQGLLITRFHCWMDSTAALQWIKGAIY